MFFLQKMVARLDLNQFEQAYSAEGGELYCPQMISVFGCTPIVGTDVGAGDGATDGEELPLRYFGGGAKPAHRALSAFHRRHPRALNDVFTQVFEFVREQGLGKLGVVGVNSAPIRPATASACNARQHLRNEQAKVRRQIAAGRSTAMPIERGGKPACRGAVEEATARVECAAEPLGAAKEEWPDDYHGPIRIAGCCRNGDTR